MAKVKSANACYTGGGIYMYYGKLNNGNHFLCWTDWEEYVLELDADPGTDENIEEAGYEDWQQAHTVRELPVMESYKTLLSALKWIVKNEPVGNYSVSDMERDITDLKEDIKAFKEGHPNF